MLQSLYSPSRNKVAIYEKRKKKLGFFNFKDVVANFEALWRYKFFSKIFFFILQKKLNW